MKNIFITGISRGIGYSIFKLLSINHNVFGSTRKIANLQQNNNETFFDLSKIIEIDFSDQINDSLDNYQKLLVNKIDNLNTHFDVFINNSGIATFKPFLEYETNSIENNIFVNMIAPIFLIQYFAKQMKEKKRGLIINISSVAVLKPFKNSSIYSSTKSAISTLINTIREELRDYNIKLINLYLGATNTEIWDSEARKELGYRMIQPDNVAQLIKSLIEMSENQDLTIEELVVRPQLGDL